MSTDGMSLGELMTADRIATSLIRSETLIAPGPLLLPSGQAEDPVRSRRVVFAPGLATLLGLGWVLHGRNVVAAGVEPAEAAPITADELAALTQTAEQGNADAQYRLGERYDNGSGVGQDDVAAVKWYRLAADQGHPRAQSNLGSM